MLNTKIVLKFDSEQVNVNVPHIRWNHPYTTCWANHFLKYTFFLPYFVARLQISFWSRTVLCSVLKSTSLSLFVGLISIFEWHLPKERKTQEETSCTQIISSPHFIYDKFSDLHRLSWFGIFTFPIWTSSQETTRVDKTVNRPGLILQSTHRMAIRTVYVDVKCDGESFTNKSDLFNVILDVEWTRTS
jgi:hypothetical protein